MSTNPMPFNLDELIELYVRGNRPHLRVSPSLRERVDLAATLLRAIDAHGICGEVGQLPSEQRDVFVCLKPSGDDHQCFEALQQAPGIAAGH